MVRDPNHCKVAIRSSEPTLPIVTDLTFCETHFLSRKRPSIQTPPAAIGVNERRNQSKENSALYDFAAQMADRTASRPRMDLGHTLQKQDKADSIQHSLPFGKTSDLDACHGSDDAQRTTQQLQVQERTSKQESRSATPYSWSDSEPSKTPLDRAVERCLLDILHTGLSPEQNRDAENAGDSQRRYCNIQELKTLLEDRKAHWEPGNSDTVLEPFIRNCFPGETITTRTKYEKTAGPLPILSPEAVPSDGFSLPLNESIPDDIAYRSQRPHDCDRTVPINTRYQDQEHSQLHADTDMMEAEVEDEKAFFRKLDEAFHEIMNPRSKEIEPTGGRPDAHESACRASIHSKNGQCQLPLKAEPLRRESAASLLCDQLGFEISHLAPSPVGCHSAGELRTRSGRHCSSRNLPNMPLDKGRTDCSQNADDARLTRPRPPLSLSTTPVDPDFSRVARGFWRPNRLY